MLRQRSFNQHDRDGCQRNSLTSAIAESVADFEWEDAARPLALYYQSAAWPPLRPCPARHPLMLVNTATGVVVPAMCGRLSCPVCVVVVSAKYAAAISESRPEHMVLLTAAGPGWPTIRIRIKRFREILNRQGCAGEQVAHVERNPKQTGNHVHLWRWGPAPDAEALQDAAVRAGFGRFTSIEPIGLGRDGVDVRSLRYGLKVPLSQDVHSDALDPAVQEHLVLNGGRLGHASRHFWRTREGQPVGGVRAAMRVAARPRGWDKAAQGRWIPC